jgi:LysM repeat protein
MFKMRLIGLLLAAGALIALLAGRSAQAQGQNLLTNPSFEGPYSGYLPNPPHPDCPAGPCNTAQVPAGWTPWWASRPADILDVSINKMPEYKASVGFANRLHEGAQALQYWTHWGTHTAGAMQNVNVPANARLRFSAWGQIWSSDENGGTSIDPAPFTMMVGIDPTGGFNPWSPAVVWSAPAAPYDYYAQLTVDAQAQGSVVTVFVYSLAAEQRIYNEAYWDDASLVVIGGGVAPASSGAGNSSSGASLSAPAAQQPTSTPDAEGVIYVIVQSGDSLWGIAAEAGLTLDELLALNNMDRDDFISVGDRIIIGHAEPGGEVSAGDTVTGTVAAEETAAAEPTDTPEPTATVPPTATPEPLSMVEPAESGGSICLTAFDDANSNGLHDSGEGLREAVAFTIADETSVVSNYVTDGLSEPYCIRGLAPASYRITRSVLDNETLTTPGDWAVSLTEGGILNIEFGSHQEEEMAVAATAPPGDETSNSANLAADGLSDEGDTGLTGRLSTFIFIGVALAVLLLVGVLVVILSSRRPAR